MMNTTQDRKPKAIAVILCLLWLLIAGAAASPGTGSILPPSRLDVVPDDTMTGMHLHVTAGTIAGNPAGNPARIAGAAPGRYTFQWSVPGSTNVNLPWGVATDSAGNIYAADNSDNTIWKFHPDGTFITKWGGTGTGYGQFDTPTNLAVNSSGYVYIAEWGNNRIQVFDPDGNYVTQWGSPGSGDSTGLQFVSFCIR